MKRRDLLKAGATLAGTGIVTRALGAAPGAEGLPSPADGGTLTLNFHGMALIVFAADGQSADVRWLAFDRESGCDIPTHLPILKIPDNSTTTCVSMAGKQWHVSGLSMTPGVPAGAPLDAQTYADQVTSDPEYPASSTIADWESFKWVPLLPGRLSPADIDRLNVRTVAKMSLTTGRFRATLPHYDEDFSILWSLATPKGVLQNGLGSYKRQALTDQVSFTVPYTGSTVSLKCASLLGGGSFDFTFQNASGDVTLELLSENAMPGETLPGPAVESYCAYYQIGPGTPLGVGDRLLPYRNGHFDVDDAMRRAVAAGFPRRLSHSRRAMAGRGMSMAGGPSPIGASSPDPYCGSMRAIQS